ncbi:hypothetical protein LOZ12_002957 [Ophidiomyces ophidiicola]|uniref:Uncharacterized protein n=1 Tax=Ophidiomyces ophidiicola TaxID=1387563 RepID=A0ACB8UWV1_9EURO|nr:hypothetical protein LOZ64_003957 [Ophidiomyces ophidiicola]KAI1945646.1 hypothetical protein LOZ62_003723 [Ophidiomyces ophidiicola]KAI1971613.1 hypothetical protein LOZ56_002899 [Ophidiomyces ophidiicola]KAI2006199.1 hypothetical protein LOZ50_003274 [Ophidiomyces ophidiicola]KAI2017452.1 hypothetical protein LOZ46_004376 [Ophidiomyces ophidiicola]
MEPYRFDDTMEVTSDPHGFPADDIEIDLDAYPESEDEVDNDVVVDDASATVSDRREMSQDPYDGSKDADMADDDYSAVNMLDLEAASYQNDHDHHETGCNVAPLTEDPYENDMDDDYEEDIDAPIPDSHSQVNIENEQANDKEEGLENVVTEPTSPQNKAEPNQNSDIERAQAHIQTAATESDNLICSQEHDSDPLPAVVGDINDGTVKTAEMHPAKHAINEISSNKKPPSHTEPELQALAEGEGANSGEINLESNHDSTVPSQDTYYENSEGPTAAETTTEGDLEAVGKDVEPGTASENADNDNVNENKTAVEGDRTESTDFTGYQQLHKVTVLYQENEISLFPPNEDDSSDMYFLEDEGLAHEPLYLLFQAFRRVLGTHVTMKDELVVFIEPLYLQLSEIAVRESNTSLHQIVQLYLDLSRNDGIEEPDPLYINLSFKSTWEADLTALRNAAESGQGLASLGQWDAQDQTESTCTENQSRSGLSNPPEGERTLEAADTADGLISDNFQPETNPAGTSVLSDEQKDMNQNSASQPLGEPEASQGNEEFLNDSSTILNETQSEASGSYEDGSQSLKDSFAQEELTAVINTQNYSEDTHDTPKETSVATSGINISEVNNDFEDGEVVTEGNIHETTSGINISEVNNDFEDGEIVTEGNIHETKPIEDNQHLPPIQKPNPKSPISPTSGSFDKVSGEGATSGTWEVAGNDGLNLEDVGKAPEMENGDETPDLNIEAAEPILKGHSESLVEQQRDTQGALYKQEPTTPGPNIDVFDIDIDLFKSPTTETGDGVLPEDNKSSRLGEIIAGSIMYDQTQKLPSSGPTNDHIEWDFVDPDVSGQNNQPLLEDDNSKTVKRPRDDDMVVAPESSGPDSKRQRSE